MKRHDINRTKPANTWDSQNHKTKHHDINRTKHAITQTHRTTTMKRRATNRVKLVITRIHRIMNETLLITRTHRTTNKTTFKQIKVILNRCVFFILTGWAYLQVEVWGRDLKKVFFPDQTTLPTLYEKPN